MAVEVGQRISDYEILDLIGAGGMGRVYRVRNVISDRIEAMKILLPNMVAEPDLGARFMAEIRTLASFDHPNIAQLRTAFTYENQLVMIMELVEGITLEQKAVRGAIPVNEVLEYAFQVLGALGYAHSRGVVHRDIKPANMMVTSHGIIKLMDFGIAKSTNEQQLTMPGSTIGSLYYMSPEQVRGTTVDNRSDIYSFGIALYELLTGRRPFQADTTFTVLNQQLNTPPQPPIEVNPNLPKALNDIILIALAKDPFERFQTAEAFSAALKSVGSAGKSAAPVPNATVLETPAAYAQTTPAYTAIPAPGAAPAAARSRRGLWMGLGATAALLALIAAATLIPGFMHTKAASTPAASPASQTGGSASETAAPSNPAPPPVAPNPVDGVSPGSASAPARGASAGSSTASAAGSPVAPEGGENSRPAARQETVETPGRPRRPVYQGQSAQQTGQQAGQPSGQQAEAAGEQAAAAPSAKELTQAGDQLMELSARADAVRSSISQMQSQQAASGYGMRTDVVSAMSRMNSYLQSGQRAVDSHDLAAAENYTAKAEKEVNFLEAFLGKK